MEPAALPPGQSGRPIASSGENPVEASGRGEALVSSLSMVAPSESEPPADDGEVGVALDVLRGLVDQELSRSERIASQARQAFALTAGFFAVVQTVAFGSFATSAVGQTERTWLLSLAAIGGLLLMLCGFATL